MTDYDMDLDFVCRALVDSFSMEPSEWLSSYRISFGMSKDMLPSGHKHLIDDLKETRKEMKERSK